MKETPLQMAQRHVAEGEQRIADQASIIEQLRQIGASVSLAEQLLIEMEATQSLFVDDLARLESESGRPL